MKVRMGYSTIAFGRENRALMAKKETPLSTFIARNKVKFERSALVWCLARKCARMYTKMIEVPREIPKITESRRVLPTARVPAKMFFEYRSARSHWTTGAGVLEN